MSLLLLFSAYSSKAALIGNNTSGNINSLDVKFSVGLVGGESLSGFANLSPTRLFYANITTNSTLGLVGTNEINKIFYISGSSSQTNVSNTSYGLGLSLLGSSSQTNVSNTSYGLGLSLLGSSTILNISNTSYGLGLSLLGSSSQTKLSNTSYGLGLSLLGSSSQTKLSNTSYNKQISLFGTDIKATINTTSYNVDLFLIGSYSNLYIKNDLLAYIDVVYKIRPPIIKNTFSKSSSKLKKLSIKINYLRTTAKSKMY